MMDAQSSAVNPLFIAVWQNSARTFSRLAALAISSMFQPVNLANSADTRVRYAGKFSVSLGPLKAIRSSCLNICSPHFREQRCHLLDTQYFGRARVPSPGTDYILPPVKPIG